MEDDSLIRGELTERKLLRSDHLRSSTKTLASFTTSGMQSSAYHACTTSLENKIGHETSASVLHEDAHACRSRVNARACGLRHCELAIGDTLRSDRSVKTPRSTLLLKILPCLVQLLQEASLVKVASLHEIQCLPCQCIPVGT